MAKPFKETMRAAMKMYSEYVKPVLDNELKNTAWRIEVVEGKTDDETAEKLDTLAGTDLFIYNKRSMSGIASRIQVGKNWRTFTIRYKRDNGKDTEFKKRKFAIENDMFYPKFTYQAYVTSETGGKLLGLAIMPTKSLFKYIDEHKDETEERHTGSSQYGQASFLTCYWDKIKAHDKYGLKILVDDKEN